MSGELVQDNCILWFIECSCHMLDEKAKYFLIFFGNHLLQKPTTNTQTTEPLAFLPDPSRAPTSVPLSQPQVQGESPTKRLADLYVVRPRIIGRFVLPCLTIYSRKECCSLHEMFS